MSGAKYDMGLFATRAVGIGDPLIDPVDAHPEDRLHPRGAREMAREAIVC
ncbi:hypothetical protein ACVBEG_27345 [Pseudomonas sp. GG8]